MIASFSSDCRGCGDRIEKGERIFSVEGITHCEDCGVPRGDERRGAATGMEDAPGYVRVLEERIERNESRVATLQMTAAKRQQEIDAFRAWARGLSTELGIEPPPKVTE